MTKDSSADALAPALYLVATPIGNARDITLRTLDILRAADVLAAEDTRSLRRLMEIHGIPVAGRPLLPYHDHNGPRMRPAILDHLRAGRSVAYASEAGTPLVSDPGFVLAREVASAGLPLTAAPGASAALAALMVAGLPSDRFTFAGFAPTADGARRRFLEEFREMPGTLIFYEAPRRLSGFLGTASEVLGGDRPAAICRELTKRFEEVRRGTLADLLADIATMPEKGEIVVCIGEGAGTEAGEDDIRAAMAQALESMPVKDAAKEVSAALGVPRREAYQIGLALKGNGS